VTSLERVLVSAGCDRSGEITEGKEVCDWIGTGSSVTEITDILEHVLVGNRTFRFSSEDEELEDDSSLSGAEWRCAITVQGFGTATLFKRVLSATVKSGSQKCWLHTHCFCSFLNDVLHTSRVRTLSTVYALMSHQITLSPK
jgi:hypothetical protein